MEIEFRRREVLLVASRDNHRSPVARPDVCQGDEDVDLTTEKLSVIHTELVPLDAEVVPRVEADGFAGLAKVDEVLVDEKGPVFVVERVFATDEGLEVIEPRGMVDEFFERRTGFVNLLIVETVRRAVVVAVNVAIPLTGLQPGDGVDCTVELGDLLGGERTLQLEETTQVEKVDVAFGDRHRENPEIGAREEANSRRKRSVLTKKGQVRQRRRSSCANRSARKGGRRRT